MVVIKLHPTSKKSKRDQDAFFRLVGECVTRWAFIDRAIFRIFRQCLSTDVNLAAAIYYKWNASQRRDMTGRVIARKYATDSPVLKKWSALNKEIERLSPVRNALAHQPVKRTGTSKSGRAHYYFSIHVEPAEVHAKRRSPRELLATDLRKHAGDADRLANKLSQFAEQQARLSSPRRKAALRSPAKKP